LDFADVRSVMSEMGKAMMGTGEAEGERRALDAAEAAISNPLLDDSSMAGANGVLINITGGSDMTLFEVDEAANRIRAEVDEDAYIIFGSTFDDAMEGRIRVSVVATGIEAERSRRIEPTVLPVHAPAVAAKPVPVEQPVSALEATVAQVLAENPGPLEDPVDEPVMTDADADKVEAVHDMLDLAHEQETVAETLFDAGEDVVGDHVEVSKESVSVKAPAGMPSARGDDDAYIPPAPSAHVEKEASHIDPLAEAALLNGSDVATKPKGPSLFERVTGGAKSKVAMFGQSKPAAEAPAKAAPAYTPSPAPKAALRSTGNGQAMLEPTLGGLDPEERLQTSATEDDLLDIPAFLRRQAN
ncbi:MAG TPA: cell division protein FtsZ, partial [Magnetovibrio sp.]